MKIMQLNTWAGRLIRRMVDVVEREQPDIVCLQEVFSCEIDIPRPDRMFSTVQILMKRLGYEHSFMSPLSSFKIEDAVVNYGNAIISRFPLVDTKTIFINGQFTPHLSINNFDEYATNLQLAKVQYEEGKYFVIANHHGRINKNRYGDQASVDAMAKILRSLQSYNQSSLPLLFSGDMNIVAESQAMQTWNNYLQSTSALFGIDNTLSELSKMNDKGFVGDRNVACDHIMVDKNIVVQRLKVLDDLISDHKALVLDFQLEPVTASHKLAHETALNP